MLPRVSRIALLWSPRVPHQAALLPATEEAARRISVTLQRVEASGPNDIDQAFQAAVNGRAGAVLALPAAEFSNIRARIAALGLKHRLPTMTPEPGFAKEGGLVQYGPSVVELAARGEVRRQDPQRRQARRSPSGAADQVCVGHQHEDREGAGPDDPAIRAAAGGSGD